MSPLFFANAPEELRLPAGQVMGSFKESQKGKTIRVCIVGEFNMDKFLKSNQTGGFNSKSAWFEIGKL